MSDQLQSTLSDPSRLAALRDAVRGRPYPHLSFDTITRVVARVLDVPMVLVSLVDDRHDFFAGATGLMGEMLVCQSTPHSRSFCKYVVHTKQSLRIDDARFHPLVCDNPSVESLGVVGYLGVPLTTSEGFTLGALCAITHVPREWSDEDELLMTELAVSVSTELELRAELTYREDAARSSDPSIDAEGLPARALDVLESVHEGVAAVDREWRLTYLNQHALRVLTVDQAPALGQSIWTQFPFLVESPICDAIQSAAQTRLPASLETFVSALRRWFDVRVVPERHGLSIYFNDVTDRREAEAALQLREAQLRNAQKMEAIGTLAGGVAHDFNNLLTVIRANAELLQTDPRLREGDTSELSEILMATSRASVLTQQLLAFGRKQVVQPRVLDVTGTLDALSPILERLMPEGVELEALVYPRVPPVMADPGQIEQLLMNLVLNARDAMTSGGVVQVRIAPVVVRAPLATATGALKAGRYLQLAVRDTGTGIAAAVLPRIFEPFFSTKPHSGGSGLGLATVFGILQQLDGGISVESVEGEGTMVRVYVPAAVNSETPADDDLPLTPARGTARILVADDESGIRSVVRRVLEANGYGVSFAHDGREALAQLDAGAPDVDLLLTDVIMPGMSGVELVETVRDRHAHLPVVMMSGYGEAVSLQKQLVKPGVHFLPKPFTAGALAATVRRALAVRSAKGN